LTIVSSEGATVNSNAAAPDTLSSSARMRSWRGSDGSIPPSCARGKRRSAIDASSPFVSRYAQVRSSTPSVRRVTGCTIGTPTQVEYWRKFT